MFFYDGRNYTRDFSLGIQITQRFFALNFIYEVFEMVEE